MDHHNVMMMGFSVLCFNQRLSLRGREDWHIVQSWTKTMHWQNSLKRSRMFASRRSKEVSWQRI